MADSFVQLAADGVGKKIDTRTEGTNSEHRQVMVIGDPATNAGVAPVDSVNGLAVNIVPALPAGTNVIGHVIADTGSTTAVTGNVTVVQPTGTNLHAVLDTTSTTAVTQATGTNLHAVVDSGSITATQGTASNLKTQATGAGTAGTADTGVLTVQGIASMTKLLVTPDSVALPANQSVNVAQLNGHTTVEGGANGVLAVGGNNASGASITQNPLVAGAQAITALPTAVSNAQNVALSADKFGRPVVLVGSIRDLTITQTTTLSATTSETTIVTAGAAGIFNDLVMLIVSNTSASTNTRIDFRDTTGGSVLFSLQSVGGAAPVGFALPIPIPQTSTATNWTAQCATSTTDVRIYAVAVKNK